MDEIVISVETVLTEIEVTLGTEGGAVSIHNDLTGRSAAACHPAASISYGDGTVDEMLLAISETIQDIIESIPDITGLLDETAHDLLDHTGLTGIPAAQIQVDWGQSDSGEVDFIKNKPSIPDLGTIVYVIEVALAQLDKDIALKTGVAVFPCPEDLTLHTLFIRFGVAPTGANAIYDMNVAGSSILSTRITIETGEYSSLDATTQPVISSANIDRGQEIRIDCDAPGATAAGQNPVLVIAYIKR